MQRYKEETISQSKTNYYKLMKNNILKHIPPFKLILCLLIITGACGEERHPDEFYTMDDFQTVKKFDANVHIYVDNSPIVDQANEDNFHLITVNVDSGRMPINEQREIAVRLSQQNPDVVSFLATIPLDNWDDQETWQHTALEHIGESFAKGALGIKVFKNIGMELKNADGEFVMIDDPQFDPVFSFLAEQEKVLFGHIGEPKNCWLPLEEMTVANDRNYFENNPHYHMYLHPEYPSYEEIIESRNNMLDKNPDMKFFGAHLGSMEWSIEMMAEHLDKYPNMAYGMGHRIPHLQYLARQDRDKLRDFIIKYQDQFIYSTNLSHHPHHDLEERRTLSRDTWREDWEFFVTDHTLNVWQVDGEFQGLQLPKRVIDKIFRENARSFYF